MDTIARMNTNGKRNRSSLLAAARAGLLAVALLALLGGLPGGSRGAAAEGETGTLYLHLHPCGAFSEAPPTDYGLLKSACVDTPYYNAAFITTEGYTYKGLPSNDFMDWTWNGVPSHIFQIQAQVDLHVGTPVVYCQNGTQSQPELMQATAGPNGGYVHPTMAGGYLVCDWFATRDVVASGSVSVDAFVCDPNFDPAGAGMNDFYVACQQPENGATFSLTAANALPAQTTGANAPGNVYWQYVAPGAIQIVGTPAAGLQTARVFCRSNLSGPKSTEFAGGAPVQLNLADGEHVQCDWYDVTAAAAQANVVQGGDAPADAGNNDQNGGDQGGSMLDLNDQSTWTGRVEISVRVCPAGFDPASGDLWNGCWDDANGIGFGIFSANQWWPQTTGDWADQMVIWDPVPQQDVTIAEGVPAGYATPIAFCDGSPVDVAGDGSIQVSVGDHATVACTFFNIPQP